MWNTRYRRPYGTVTNQYFRWSIRNLNNFLHRFVIANETWIHYDTPETNRQSKQWIFLGESAPKKVKTYPSTGKVMATNCRKEVRSQGSFAVNFTTIMHQHGHPELSVPNYLNCATNYCRTHRNYLLLAPYDFFLFRNMNTWVVVEKIQLNYTRRLLVWQKRILKILINRNFLEGFKKWHKSLKNCFDLKREYKLKNKLKNCKKLVFSFLKRVLIDRPSYSLIVETPMSSQFPRWHPL